MGDVPPQVCLCLQDACVHRNWIHTHTFTHTHQGLDMLLLEANAAAAHSVIFALVRRGALEGQLGVNVQARSCSMSRSACVCVHVCVCVCLFALELREAPANWVGRASPRATRIALTSASEPSSWSTLERMEDCVCGHKKHTRDHAVSARGEEARANRARLAVRSAKCRRAARLPAAAAAAAGGCPRGWSCTVQPQGIVHVPEK